MTVQLAALRPDHHPLVTEWLQREHVRRWWGEPEENARLLAESPEGLHCALIEADGLNVGLVV
jgi:aminoglycoside 6'-N-acetyltransferase